MGKLHLTQPIEDIFDLDDRIRNADRNSPEWRNLWIIRFVNQPCKVNDIIKYMDRKNAPVSRALIYKIVHRYNEEGLEGILRDKRDQNCRPRVLDQEGVLALAETLKNGPPSGLKKWSRATVAAWIADYTGRHPVCEKTAGHYWKMARSFF